MSQISKKFLESNSVDGTKIRLSNNQALRARNVANSADIDMFRLSTSNLTQILTTLVPDTSNTRDLGTDVNRFATIYGKDIQACLFSGTGRLLTADGSLTNQMELFSVSGSTPSGATVNSHIRTMIASNNLGLYTASDATVNSNPTGALLIETGNKTAGTGNSGGITIQTGTSSGGVRGPIDLNASEIDVNSSKITNLATPTAGTDAANKSYVDSAAIYVTGDLGQVSFSLANNQSTYSDVTGIAFANGTSRSAEVHYSIYVNATSSLYESGKLRLIQKGSSWAIARSMVGDDALVDFDVTTSGQLQYKTANYSGFSAATLKCRAITTSV